MMNVGDIAYIRISTRGAGGKALVPIKVTEKLIRESLEGKIVSYVVRGPTGEDYEIDPEQEEIFTTLNEAREVVTKEAMAYVDRVIGKAKAFEQRYFAKDIALHNVQPMAEDDEGNSVTA